MSRVVIFSRYFGYAVGGAERSVLELMKDIERKGNTVTAIIVDQPGGLASDVRELDIPGSWCVRRVTLPYSFIRFRFLDYFLNKKSIRSITNLLENTDVLYAYGTLSPALINCYHGKTVYLVRDEYGLGWNKNYYRGLRRLLQGLYHLVEFPLRQMWRSELKKSIMKSDLVANSNFVASELRKLAPKGNIEVIHSKIDMSRLLLEYQSAVIPEKPGVILIGNSVLKGSDIVKKIAVKIPEENFYIFDRSVEAISRKGNLIYMPWQISAGSIYRFAKLVLVPSRWEEAYPRVVLEAKALNIPIVASRKGGIPEALDDDGYLVDDFENIDRWVGLVKKCLERS